MKFTEAQLESAIIDLLKDEGYPYVSGESIVRTPQEVLIQEDLKAYLNDRYKAEGITGGRSTRLYVSWKPPLPVTCMNRTRPS